MKRHLALAAVSAAAFAAITGPAFAATADDKAAVAVTAGVLAFTTAPAVSDLANIQRNGLAQTIDGTLDAWGVNDASGSPDGWNVTVQGVTDVPTNKTGVFTERVAATGAAVTDARQLAAGSLRINTISSAFTAVGSTTGTAPAYDCTPGCAVDSPTPIRVALAAPNAGMGTFAAAAATTTLSLPSTVKAVRDNNSYQLDLLWTLASGPGTPNA